jgi:hypothetical protein
VPLQYLRSEHLYNRAVVPHTLISELIDQPPSKSAVATAIQHTHMLHRHRYTQLTAQSYPPTCICRCCFQGYIRWRKQ